MPVYADNNTFNIGSFNQFQLNYFSPYSPMYYTVLIYFPVIDLPSSEIVTPEVTLSDFKSWCGQFIDVDDEHNVLKPLVLALIDIAKEYIDVQIIGEKSYKRAVCYYAGHYVYKHIQMLKDEANQATLDESKEVKMELETPQGSKIDFKTTILGQMFWSIYGTVAKYSGGIYLGGF